MASPYLQYPPPMPSNASQLASEQPVDDIPTISTPVLIVGAGPVGMLEALILARIHGQECMIIEREATTTVFPKMEYTNGRSMTIYRLLGLIDEVRALGNSLVPEHIDMNETIVTSLAEGGKLIHVWERPSIEQTRKNSHTTNDGSQYREPYMRCDQIILEKWLKTKIEAEKLITGHWNTTFIDLKETEDHVITEIKRSDGTTAYVKSQYVIACDGGGSLVRKAAGLESIRTPLGMTVVFAYFRSSSLLPRAPNARAWHTNVINGGLFVSQNEKDLWTGHFVVPPGVDATKLTADDVIRLIFGGCLGPVDIDYEEIFCHGIWRTDVAVANSFRSKLGRVFLAGDSAHQLSPLGGHGLNSGLADAFDLAWKLSAKLKHWGGEQLLASYDTERRQIALENLSYVKAAAGIFMPVFAAGQTYGTDVLNGEGENSSRARQEILELCQSGRWLHNQNRNILGYTYKESPVVSYNGEVPAEPNDSYEKYIPTTYPGSQLPHVWLKNGASPLDLLKMDAFNLIDLTGASTFSELFVEAAKALKLPLHTIKLSHDDSNLGKIYERNLILVRPDSHVGWRQAGTTGLKTVEEATEILRIVSGREHE